MSVSGASTQDSWKNEAGGGTSGIISINNDYQQNQTIAAGSGITLLQTAGTTTISASGGGSLPVGTEGQFLYYNSGWKGLNLGTTGQIVNSNGTDPAWGSVSLSSGSAGISGTLAVGNGGTGRTTIPSSFTNSTYAAWNSTGSLVAPRHYLQADGGSNTGAGPFQITIAAWSETTYYNGNSAGPVLFYLPQGSSITPGQIFNIINNTTGSTSVQVWSYNDTAQLATLPAAAGARFTYLPEVYANDTAASWGVIYLRIPSSYGTSGQALISAGNYGPPTAGTLGFGGGGTNLTALPTSAAASTFAAWDANINFSANNFLPGSAAVNAATVTLTVSSPNFWRNNASTPFPTYTLPLASTLTVGTSYTFVNTYFSTSSNNGSIIKGSGGTILSVIYSAGTIILTCINNGDVATVTDTNSWIVQFLPTPSISGGVYQGYTTHGSGTQTMSAAAGGLFDTWNFSTTTTATLTLPVLTTNLGSGYKFYIYATGAAGVVTVNSSGANLVATLNQGQAVLVISTSITATDATGWKVFWINHGETTTGTVTVGSGGTGVAATTVGGILVGSSTSAFTNLAIGSNNYVLTSNGTTASWAVSAANSATATPTVNTITEWDANRNLSAQSFLGTTSVYINAATTYYATIAAGTLQLPQTIYCYADGGTGNYNVTLPSRSTMQVGRWVDFIPLVNNINIITILDSDTNVITKIYPGTSARIQFYSNGGSAAVSWSVMGLSFNNINSTCIPFPTNNGPCGVISFSTNTTVTMDNTFPKTIIGKPTGGSAQTLTIILPNDTTYPLVPGTRYEFFINVPATGGGSSNQLKVQTSLAQTISTIGYGDSAQSVICTYLGIAQDGVGYWYATNPANPGTYPAS